ncbi:MAG: hypothetical protein P4M14_10995 [Gammaproteobacteria bacterium]|nr:hypothetical protein [Gammaproteobacteria bacterium]
MSSDRKMSSTQPVDPVTSSAQIFQQLEITPNTRSQSLPTAASAPLAFRVISQPIAIVPSPKSASKVMSIPACTLPSYNPGKAILLAQLEAIRKAEEQKRQEEADNSDEDEHSQKSEAGTSDKINGAATASSSTANTNDAERDVDFFGNFSEDEEDTESRQTPAASHYSAFRK